MAITDLTITDTCSMLTQRPERFRREGLRTTLYTVQSMFPDIHHVLGYIPRHV